MKFTSNWKNNKGYLFIW